MRRVLVVSAFLAFTGLLQLLLPGWPMHFNPLYSRVEGHVLSQGVVVILYLLVNVLYVAAGVLLPRDYTLGSILAMLGAALGMALVSALPLRYVLDVLPGVVVELVRSVMVVALLYSLLRTSDKRP